MQRGSRLANIEFKFNEEKAVEVILYLAEKLSVPNIYGICKTLYLADKASLEKYGRFIFGESYVAMSEGATPSNVYDLLKHIRQKPTNELKIDDNNVIALRQAELDHLSKSDIECLDHTIAKYGRPANWDDRKKACHDVAWRKAWNKKEGKRSVKIPIESIAGILADSDDLIDYLSNSG